MLKLPHGTGGILTALFTTLLLGCGSDPAPQDSTPDGAQPQPDTADTAPEVDPETPPAWRHEGPITHGAPVPPTFPLFVERSEDALVDLGRLGNGRALVVDFDGDGRDDIVVLPMDGDEANTPRFVRNVTEPGSSEWAFEDWTSESGMEGELMVLLVFGDIDNDGDMDAFSGTSFRSAPGTPALWINDGTGRFTRREPTGLMPHTSRPNMYKEMAAATLADFDGDGLLDLYIAMFNDGDLQGNYSFPSDDELYRGDGAGNFNKIDLPSQHNPLTSQMESSWTFVPRRAYGLCPADYDDDGDLDLFVNNYGAGRPAANSSPLYWDWNLMWRNDGEMNFTEVSEEAEVHATFRGIGGVEEETPLVMGGETFPGPIGGNGFGCHWGDFDNDGDLDLIVGTIAHPDYPQSDRTMLHVNPGGAPGTPRVFTEESAARGLEYYEDELHPFFVDIDNDGRLDLAMSRLRGGSKLEFYLQNTSQHFDMQSWEDTGVDIERPGPSLWLDVDGDGDLDFFNPRGAQGMIFENRAAQNNFLVIETVARAPRDSTGTRVTMTTSVGKHVREVIGGTGHYNTQPSRRLYFGLATDSGASEVTIRWPDGQEQILGDVRANLTLRVVQGEGVTILSEGAAAAR